MGGRAPEPPPAPDEERLSVLAPSGRDAEVLAAVAASGGFATEILPNVAALRDRIHEGACAVVLAEEVLSPADAAALAGALEKQAPWSDLPILLLLARSGGEGLRRRILGVLEPHASVIILERPLQRRTLLAALAAAVRVRRRQRETRSLLEQLDLERRRQQAVLAAMPVGIVVTDASGRVVDTNAAEQKIWGGPPPVEVLGDDPSYQAWLPGTGPRVEPRARALARALTAGEEITDQELDIVALDGARRTLLNSAYPIRAADDRVVGAVAVHVDITDRARTERAEQILSEVGAALSESLDPEITLATLTRLMAARIAVCCAVAETDDRGELHRLVVEVARDRPPEEAHHLLGLLHGPTGEAIAHQVLRSRRSALMVGNGQGWVPGAPEIGERAIEPSKDCLLAVPLLAHGRALGVLGLIRLAPARGFDARDVALAEEIGRRAALALDNGRLHREAQAALEARAESLAELEAFMAASPVGLAVLDRGLKFLRVNDVLAALHGLPALAHLGNPLDEVIAPAKADQIVPAIRKALATGEPVLNRPLTIDAPAEGAPARHFLVSAVPLLGATGQPRAVGLVMSEITRIKQAEETLIRQAAFREQIIDVLAHDLRTPLQAITFSAHTLRVHADVPETCLRAVTRIDQAAARMAHMVADLLDVTRVRQYGGLGVAVGPVDLAEIARAVVAELEAAHPDREIRLSVSGDGRAELDAPRMAQVISNLVSNALTHGAAGTAVRVGLTGSEGELTLTVHNHGAPIPADVLPTIFDPFRQGRGEGAGEPGTGGLGLGLFIVREIVRSHGGAVSVTSSAEAGTTFTVRLPRRGAREAPARAA